jgi:hypothetical protein
MYMYMYMKTSVGVRLGQLSHVKNVICIPRFISLESLRKMLLFDNFVNIVKIIN